MFSMSPSILAFYLIKFKSCFLASLGKIGCLRVEIRFKLFRGLLMQQLSYYSLFPSILTESFFTFLDAYGIFLGSTHIFEQLSFSMISWSLTFEFDLILGSKWACSGIRLEFDNCFWVQSYSWTTFIFYDSLNSDIWISLNFGVSFVFLGP